MDGKGSPSSCRPRRQLGAALSTHGASLVAQTVKNLLAMQETWVRSLGQEDLLEKEMATHSSILAWKINGQEAWWATVRRVAKEI